MGKEARTPARLSGSAFASLRQWGLSGRRPAPGGPASQTLRAPSTRTFPPRIFTHRQQTSDTAGKQGPNQDQTSLLKSCVSRPGALIGCHPQQSCPRRAHPETPPSAPRPVPGVCRRADANNVSVPTFGQLRSLGLFSGWLESRLHAQTSRQKGYIEVVSGAGILRSGLPPSEWRAATQGFGPAIRHINVPVHCGPRGYIRSLPMH